MTWFKRFLNLNVNEFWYKPEEIDPEGISCEVDGDPVDCFTFTLEEKGFEYNEDEDWWERTWSVKTRTGQETSKEVYKQDYPSGQWKSMMFGDQGDLFYEQTVGTRTDGTYTY